VAASASVSQSRTAQIRFKGANLASYSPTIARFNALLDDTQMTLRSDGGNAVEVVLECWMRSRTDVNIDCKTTAPTGSTGDVTIPDADVAHAMQTAHKLGLFVVLKPHVDIRNCTTGDCFRGDIQPRSWTAWFASYTAMMVHYARLAKANRAGMLVVGTELTSSQKCSSCARGWNQAIDAIKRAYSGALTYAANVTDYASFPAWPRMTVLGDDGYFPLVTDAEVRAGQGDPSVSTLGARWSNFTDDAGTTHDWLSDLQKFSQRYRKPVIFTEIGYQRLYGAANFLNDFTAPPQPTPDPGAQAKAYDAFFTAFHGRKWFQGAFMWDYQGDRTLPAAADTDFDPRGQPAEGVLRHWWALRVR
jgi:hypothetical protein